MSKVLGLVCLAFIACGPTEGVFDEGTDDNPLSGSGSTKHIMGTARMGDDPETSVVDRFGRMHELDNVHIADGSVFTTSGGFNPTLTIMALALRAARHMA